MHVRGRRMLAGVVAAVAVLSVSGCTLPFTAPAAAPSIAATPLPAAPSVATPALSPTGPAPALANTGTNWAPMLAGLLTYGQWLLANPGAGAVSSVAAGGCPLADELTNETTSLSQEGWRLAPAPLTISSLGAPAALAPGETRVTVTLQASRSGEAVVGATGQAVSAVGALPPTSFDVTVVLGGDGKWRLCSALPSLDSAAAAPAGQSLL